MARDTPTSVGGGGFRGPVEAGYGTVFKIRTDGSGLQSLLYFYGDWDGHPFSGLTLSGSTLYGTTMSAVFKVNTDGSGGAELKNGLASCYSTLTCRAFPRLSRHKLLHRICSGTNRPLVRANQRHRPA